jgi:signal transduction histidine kinase
MKLGRFFGDLKVRPKLMVLHNLFFLILACSVYFTLIPLFEQRVAKARTREISLVTQMFSEDRPLLRLPGMEIYEYQEGTCESLALAQDVREWLDAHPGTILQRNGSDTIYRKDQGTGHYRKLILPQRFYDEVVFRARLTLLVVLGAIYFLAILVLEVLIMPRYVYGRIRTMLAADQATRLGDRDDELIPDEGIPGDEIGQIMRSRNATVTELRKQEDRLGRALARLEHTAADLQHKNALLEAAKKNLADQDRLVSLGLLSASVAHELNTPLSVLQGSIEKMIETRPDRTAQERLARMLRVTQRLRKISEGLVDFSRARKQEPESVVARTLIDDAWSLVAIDEKASEVNFQNLASDRDVLIGNPDRLIQVFVNLIRNALYAIKSSGNILVRSRNILENGQDWVAISVEDDGEGIPPDVLPNIFEAFVTTRLDARGTGLGLTVAEGIVHQHGGKIEAGNRPGGGARLEVRLPAAQRVAGNQVAR